MTRQGERSGVPDLTRHDPATHRGLGLSPGDPALEAVPAARPRPWTLSDRPARTRIGLRPLRGEGTSGTGMSRGAPKRPEALSALTSHSDIHPSIQELEPRQI